MPRQREKIHKMNSSIEKILFSEEEIREKVKQTGKKISDDYRNKNLVLVGILKGSVIFMSDLMRAIDTDCKIIRKQYCLLRKN